MPLSVGYCCKYTPLELMVACGCEPNGLGEGNPSESGDASALARPLHPNMCTFAKELYAAARETDVVVLVDCCDSIRRVGDTLAALSSTTPLMLELPHCCDGCARTRFADALIAFAGRLEELTNQPFDRDRLLAAWSEVAAIPPHEGPSPAPYGTREPYVALLGARVRTDLRSQLQGSLSIPLKDFTCRGPRRLTPPPPDAADLSTKALLYAYANALLDQLPCLRMADITARRTLLDDPALAGIIYSTVKFCDFYPFEYAALAESTDLPIVKIETGYEPKASEQVLTRVAAFNELLDDANSTNSAIPMPTVSEAHPMDASQDANRQALFAGIDSGSTSTNVVVVDSQGVILAQKIVRTGAKATRSARAAIESVAAELGVDVADFQAIVGTGYGRNHLDFVTRSVTEITCHAKGAHHLDPSAQTIIDIGGQDSKVIAIDEQGRVETFAMNDKCAAGTGRFFEAMARTLEIDLETMASMTEYRNVITLSSLCTVFAESEVIGLIAEDCDTVDIVGGLNRAVATRTETLVRRAGATGPYLMTGGVARNHGLVAELARRLGEPVVAAADPDMVGALGAALIAASC